MKKLLDPKQELFLASYTDPKSATFGNALQSALKAGYKQEYAEKITYVMPDWLSENIGRHRMLKKAEKNLKEVQELPVIDEENKVDKNILGERNKVDMFIAKTIGKDIYSDRRELTGADGKDLITGNVIEFKNGS